MKLAQRAGSSSQLVKPAHRASFIM